MAIKVINMPCIFCEDIQELIGANWDNCEFAQRAENGSFQSIWCDDSALEVWYEILEYEKKSWGDLTLENFDDEEEYEHWLRTGPLARLENQIKLVEALRKMGYYDEMLIYVSW